MSSLLKKLESLMSLLSQDAVSHLSTFGIFEYLQNSEAQLLATLHNSPQSESGKGNPMFGFVPYLIANPPDSIKQHINDSKVLEWIWGGLKAGAPTKLTDTDYKTLVDSVTAEKGGLVGPDGTIYSFSKYDQLDPEWLFAVMDNLIVKLFDDKAHFAKAPVSVALSGNSPNQVRIVIVGDWGTGEYADNPAVQVMNQINNLNPKPDYIIHLGDVYYAGTNEHFHPEHEEVKNYLNLWPNTATQAAGTSFMLNSNHEMYSGAKGYFEALNDDRFIAQNKNSYFALTYAGWTFIGLDSAYYDTSAMFMDGSITKGDPKQTQPNWVKGLKLDPAKTIVLTHHNGLKYDGTAETDLWKEIHDALGGDPAFWYWGHVHNGISYISPTVAQKNTLARCVGHGAFPFADASGMNKPNPVHYNYYAHSPNHSESPRVYNGFMLMTITSDGQIKEEWYEQTKQDPVFTFPPAS